MRSRPSCRALGFGLVSILAIGTEALLAGGLAADNSWWVTSLPDELARYNLVFGLWKGDLTLKRKIVKAFRQLESDGTLAAILERYGAVPMGQRGSVPAL